ncbi:DUF1552 domain-containing protein [Rhodopirellula sp. MGV]|uniref:DUF1552 domain-containing protein n=1 Tax=Rhodopirellula sp. MGV TaxID=2023130 RepID=UPI000B95E7BD|nr:DUF1552 domain-containing protein [Rhodopirellula sp. MGV]OYP38133.1 hypothetical protein CGZ80_02545 [Rhodopirellula sp. MGV]PNY38470.1 DUF1552 domain-containing protein [Rhodopirellula baltica]
MKRRNASSQKIAFRNRTLSRRHVLRGAGVGLALPMLTAMRPALGAKDDEVPKRMVAICAGLGFHSEHLFPENEGKLDGSTPYLQKLREHQSDMTLLSGLSHPNQNGNNGHASEMTWLTSAQRPGLAGFKNTISLDQLIASSLGGVTRLPYLCLSSGHGSLSWTSSGVNIPDERSPAKVFQKLFVNGTPKEIESQLVDLQRGRSILDTIRQDAKRLERTLGPRDRQKLDEYYASIRDLENRFGESRQWATRPKPVVDYETPKDVVDKQDIIAKQQLMYDMMRLAIETDSTRVITFSIGGMNSVPSNIAGVKTDWHNLSHHGKDEQKIAELRLIEEAEFEAFSNFLALLKSTQESGQRLLDGTTVLFGSNLGNASSHDWHNLPILLAGGGFRHGHYTAHDSADNTPLANLFVSLAQWMGVEIDTFGSSTAAGVRGFERA